jgi:hypothetical protein
MLFMSAVSVTGTLGSTGTVGSSRAQQSRGLAEVEVHQRFHAHRLDHLGRHADLGAIGEAQALVGQVLGADAEQQLPPGGRA